MGAAYLLPDEVTRGNQTTAGRWSIAKYGGPTTQVETLASVGTSVQRILVNNARRLGWIIYNRSSNSIDLSYKSSVTSGSGVPLPASNGFATVSIDFEGEAPISEVWAISSGASSSIYIVEYYRV